MNFAQWKRLPKKTWCKRCGCYQKEWHRHWILDKDDPQWDGHPKANSIKE